MASIHAGLTERFARWDARTRGVEVYPHAVPVEPPFARFPGHHFSGDEIDDGLRPTFLSSLVSGLWRKPAVATPADEEPPEPAHVERGEVVELPLFLSPSFAMKGTEILESQAKPKARVGKMPVRLFGGLTVCHCGKKMYVPSASRKYECAKGCKNKIATDDLEAIFMEELQGYFRSPERVTGCVETALRRVSEKEQLLANHQREITKVREEMARTHRLYLDGQVPLESFGTFHKPLEERLSQLQSSLPRLEAEVDHAMVRNLSVDAVLNEAHELHARWHDLAPEDKQRIVHSLVEGITIGKDEVEITFSHVASSEEHTNTQQLMKTITASAWT